MRVPTRPPARSGPASAHSHPAGAPVTELDVRDDLRNRREPFSRIMAAVESLPKGSVLHLRATFEPVPLLTVLGRKGFVHESEEHEPEDWSVWFWRPAGGDGASDRTTQGSTKSAESVAASVSVAASAGVPASASAPAAQSASTTTAPSDDPSGDVYLDVRGLEPPEPMVRTLAALEALAPGCRLVQVNVRAPQFLLPILTERGFTYEIDESVEDRVLVRIRRGG